MNSTTDTTPIVEIRDLEFSYHSNLSNPGHPPVLRIPELQIRKGEKVFIYGPSGTGKTTLLGLLAGVLSVKKGSIRLLGQDLAKMAPSERDRFRGNHIGYVFQMFNLIPYLNVRDNIMLSAQLNSVRQLRLEKSTVRAEAERLAGELGLERLLEKPVTELSVGQQQRVAVARAILGSPELIIADEPTSALDYDHREKFLQLLFKECTQTRSTVLFVSHDRQLEPLFDRCISLQEINRL
jgi:putative ABC transport system ATP-binding protein